jgi:hypothetical protein
MRRNYLKEEDSPMNKINTSPPLETHIKAVLGNTSASAAELTELIREVEAATTTAEETAKQERAKAVDLVASPDPKTAYQRIVEAEIFRDQLKTVLPKLRETLSAALAEESKERWLADYWRVRQQLDEAVTLFKNYQQHAEQIAHLFAVAAEVDKEVSRINGTAPDGVHYRLLSVELTARGMGSFTLDNPSLSQTVELRAWDNSGHKLWPHGSSGSLAAAYAQSVAAPYHPGPRWSDPEYQTQRRAEVEKEQRRLADYYADATAQQEQRKNAEERERARAFRQARPAT